jgi:hypothetical protein
VAVSLAPPGPAPDAPTFWEIFLNSRSVVLEKPKALFLFLLALEICRSIVSEVSSRLMAPMAPIMATFAATSNVDQEAAIKGVVESLFGPGGPAIALKCLVGFCLPLAFLPILALALARVALGLWDGYAPSLGDLKFAVQNYLASLSIGFFISLYALVSFFMILVVLTPFSILSGLSKDPAIGGFLAVTGLVFSGLIVYSLFWPFFRRVACLLYLPFYSFLDGKIKEYGIGKIFFHLERFPNHANQAAGVIILTSAVPTLIISVALMGLIPGSLFNKVVAGLFQFVLDLLVLWAMTAMAGLYRLVLYPLPASENPESPLNSEEVGETGA